MPLKQSKKEKYLPYVCGFEPNYHNSTSPLAKRLERLPMAWETRVQSQVESYQRLKKWYLMLPC